MFVELILLFLLIGFFASIAYAFYSYELAKLYRSNEHFLKEERKRYENNFKAAGFAAPRGPTMSGNSYTFTEKKELKVTAEERSALISYI